MASRKDDILLIGLGRFGRALALTMTELGHDVLAIDASAKACQAMSGDLAHVVQADATDPEALRQVGADQFRSAVVAIGNDIQASIMATFALVDFGVPRIWAKAITSQHGAILQRVGAHRVVFPERDMGVRVAHTMIGRTIDYVELDDEFVLIETTVPREVAGKSIADAGVRSTYEVSILCVKRPGGKFTYATQETILNLGDLVVLFGETRKAEAFAALT
ncbi:MAG: TrkA family potassium uptake protein [Acidimicrobiales bacterium]|nr:TrkA family potassium uptake protein [Acidimicrobiales bacterium]